MQITSGATGGDWALNRIRELEAALRACIGCATLPDPLAARNAVIATVKLVLGDKSEST